MKLSQFNFKLPEALIAKYPPEEKEEGRLMIVHRKNGKIEHKHISDLLSYFSDGDCLVFNDTKVFPARLHGAKEKTDAAIEVFLLRELNEEQRLWDVLVDPARKIRIGNKLYFGDGDTMIAEVVDNTTSRGRTLRFLYDGPHDEFKARLFALGEMPLPRTVGRPVEPSDTENYQTIFARNEGAVAAPTAGLHFSREMMKRFEIKGVNAAFVTLHLGLGRFRRIEVEDLSKHKPDAEEFIVTAEAEAIINKAVDAGKRVCAVGSTVISALEASVTSTRRVRASHEWTNKFLFPPYEVKVANSLICNFQLPMSPMQMIAATFAGYDLCVKAYQVAVKEEYQFGTYGDAMLVL